MANRSKQKGDRWERECRDILEVQGHFVTKAGGSLGMFDLIAIGKGKTRCIQCRCNNWFKSKQERYEMEQIAIENPRVTVELWRKDDRKPAPCIKWFSGVWRDSGALAEEAQFVRAQLRKENHG